jgi:hypothetical protein
VQTVVEALSEHFESAALRAIIAGIEEHLALDLLDDDDVF